MIQYSPCVASGGGGDRWHCFERLLSSIRPETQGRGRRATAAPLHPTSTATSVRVRDGKPLVTDGPFAETREQLGGFFLIAAKDLDEAIDIAGRIPAGRWGTVEIRPVMEIPGLPAGSIIRQV